MQRQHHQTNTGTVIFAGNVIDNVQPIPQPNTAIYISKGRITAIRPCSDPGQPACGSQQQVVFLPELTILPAFIDCHVHLALDGLDFHGALSRWTTDGAWLPLVRQNLAASSDHGLVVVRDGGDNGNIGLQTKYLINRGELKGPRILACGQAIYKKGRYGSFLGPGISTPDEARRMVDSLYQQGADWIKVLVSGIVSFQEYGRVGAVQFTQQELNSLVDHAHSLGLPVMAHASSDEAVRLAVTAGVDSIEHGYFLTTSSLAAMAEKNIPWVPTVIPVANQVLPEYQDNLSSHSLDVITRTYELQLQKIAEAASLGVPLGIGTDAGASGVLHGSDYLRELDLFTQAGLKPAEIIKAATSTAARICGLEQEMGTLEAGKKACLIGVKGNPLEDLAALRKIEFLLI